MSWKCKLWMVLLSIVCAAPCVNAQERFPKSSEDALGFYVDAASFGEIGGTGDRSYVEVYYMINRSDLSFMRTSDGLRASFRIEASLTDTMGEVQAQDISNKEVFVQSIEDTILDRSLFTLSRFMLAPGRYDLRVRITDLGSNRSGVFKDTIAVRRYPPGALSLSDLELATSIMSDSSKGKFTKGGLRVIPNPLRIYNPNVPLYFYSEVYYLSPQEGTYSVRYFVIDPEGGIYKRLPTKVKPKLDQSSVEAGGISVAGFPPGKYTLRLEIIDNVTEERSISQKSFYVWHPAPSSFTEEQAREFEDEIKYIASPKDMELYHSLSLTGKAGFAADFWRSRDPTPSTPRNERREEHHRRLAYVREHFLGPKEGIGSDMGRVYIMYGPPDDREQHPQSMGEKPYEIWYYFDIEGGVIFVFADLEGFGRYTLLHSTARNEISDPDWERIVRVHR